MPESTKIDFTKMHGTGNDFILVEKSNLPSDLNYSEFARYACHRKFGIGSDGVLILSAHDDADFEMVMYNPDGSLAEMCGNGIRCIGKYIHDHKLNKKTELRIMTGRGILPLKIMLADDGSVSEISVAMGDPDFTRANIPVSGDGITALAESIKLPDGCEYEFYAVSMGNPHAVVFVEDVDNFPVKEKGPLFECHELFPNRINVEFIEHLTPESIKVRIWERGAGETLSCGTGVCASAAVCRKLGIIKNEVRVIIPGGELKVSFDKDGSIYLTGPAVEVFAGSICI